MSSRPDIIGVSPGRGFRGAENPDQDYERLGMTARPLVAHHPILVTPQPANRWPGAAMMHSVTWSSRTGAEQQSLPHGDGDHAVALRVVVLGTSLLGQPERGGTTNRWVKVSPSGCSLVVCREAWSANRAEPHPELPMSVARITTSPVAVTHG